VIFVNQITGKSMLILTYKDRYKDPNIF